MTSYKNFPKRFTKIDDLVRRDYRHITEADRCYFVGEYTARKGYAYSDTNQLILNFKKPMDRAGQPDWHHKEKTIQVAANVLGASHVFWSGGGATSPPIEEIGPTVVLEAAFQGTES